MTTDARVPERGIPGWPLWHMPSSVRFLFGGVLASVGVWSIVSVGQIGGLDWVRAAGLVTLSCIYPALVRSLQQVRDALTLGHGPNVQGVWVVAAALVLPPSLILVVGISAYAAEWRYMRAMPGAAAHRYVYNAAAAVLAAQVARCLPGHGLSHSVGVLLVFEIVNIGLVVAIAGLNVWAAAGPTSARDELRTRLATMRSPRSLAMDAACLVCALTAGEAAAASGLVTATAALAVPGLVVAQRWAVLHEFAAATTTDPDTGLLTSVAWLRLVALHPTWPLAILVFWPPNTAARTLRLCSEVLRSKLEEDTSLGVIGHHAGGVVAAVSVHAPIALALARQIENGLESLGVHVVVEVAVAMDCDDVPAALNVALADSHACL